ncbi:thioesterase domain-containing protein [Dongia sedimenti]|uniref:Thioesterase domain-containing protein n=1 Tax=Dongia sedimenti TaxID=3064282 RepID=A0ABU0YVA8_9PROT|nr:thioesterase domain-containing protein [Rhodospirillaceae bacterium R-7]
MLFPTERHYRINDVPLIASVRRGDLEQPLVLFLTGGGVLARIAYGDPEAAPQDFLDHWLDRIGWGLIAPSYPCDHPIFAQAMPELGLGQWAATLAALFEGIIGETPRRPLIACGWSMGGRIAFALVRALRARGVPLDGFVSLCATPPFPRLNGDPPAERLLPNGLWDLTWAKRDGLTRDERWSAELDAIAAVEGRIVITPDRFGRHYRMNVPIGLWGPELEPFFENVAPRAVADELREAGTFSGADYPLCAAIVPADSRDHRHALTDPAIWGSITVQSLLHNDLGSRSMSELSPETWESIRDCVWQAPARLTRHLSGGHFFFVGSHGAAKTVEHLQALHQEMQRIRSQLRPSRP